VVELAAAAPLALLVLASHGSLRRPPAWALLAPLAAFALAPGGSVHHPEKAQGAYGRPNPGLWALAPLALVPIRHGRRQPLPPQGGLLLA
jgi:hypothetical protein